MQELTGEGREEDAWNTIFSPADVVAIKVNRYGYPKFYSRPETVGEIIRGLNMAGVSNDNIVIYDRYTNCLAQVGYAPLLPAGVRFASAVVTTPRRPTYRATTRTSTSSWRKSMSVLIRHWRRIDARTSATSSATR